MSKGYKLDISDGHQAVAIASFEKEIPRFFDNSGGHNVVQQDHSFFPGIKIWNEWEIPNEGLREMLMIKLDQIRSSHEQNIRDNLQPDSAMTILATSSLNFSYTWSAGIIKMRDDI